MRHDKAALGAAATLALVVAFPATASAHGGDWHGGGEPVTTIAGGLDGPRQLSGYKGDRLVVAESDSGEVSSVDPYSGEVRTLLTGMGNAQGVDHENGLLYVAVGEAAGPPPEEGAPPPAEGAAPPPAEPPAEGPSQLLVEATPYGHVTRSFDLLAYELEHNPDGQEQWLDEAETQPADTLSNPFSVLAQDHRVLVADAGANAVLSIDLYSGEISTFFVPPVVTDVPGCEAAENNPGTTGCDPVPTEITEGPDGLVYVGTLGAEVPGAGRVYVLDQHGKPVDVITGLTSVTGVAVDRHGTVYVSNVLEGAPEGEGPPPEGFDPTTVGQMTRISPDGERATAEVVMPTGLEIEDGELYASAWSVGIFLGMPGVGEVQRIGDSAFAATP
ncbi:ScyD/ScyE family protein [Geodermatophilus sabuli]|uniref:ScyD/ScyE family protein n=1 Tax=Geodermatophilus sabuli TaxID=1564158 RepID=A0A7K3VY39_9ACTN|nr:ScyD/ScyE family protein [Geodermatophilus sabuli]NEK57023.1 ScyD/ScyE family protein [Geodermatophilus sabuli]